MKDPHQDNDDWLVTGARVAFGPERAVPADIEIRNGRIRKIHAPARSPAGKQPHRLQLEGLLVLPGLINAHDHLEFSLFPRLGRGGYPSARAWAEDIYRPDESPIKEHLEIPKSDRLLWGGIKSLLSGVTTVCHHNPYVQEVFGRGFPVRVVERFAWAHSLAFSPDIADAFRKAPRNWPFIVHVAEGADAASRREIFELDRMGALDDRTVIVHAAGLDKEGLSLVEERGASIIWCPSSNLFTLGQTLDRRVFEKQVLVALATDSSMTAEGDLFDELQVAHRCSGLPAPNLYAMVTDIAAGILRLSQGEGKLIDGGVADLLAVRDRGLSPAHTLMHTHAEDVEMVMSGGKIKLLAPSLVEQLPVAAQRPLSPVQVENHPVYIAGVDVRQLLKTARRWLGPDFPVRLGARRIEA